MYPVSYSFRDFIVNIIYYPIYDTLRYHLKVVHPCSCKAKYAARILSLELRGWCEELVRDSHMVSSETKIERVKSSSDVQYILEKTLYEIDITNQITIEEELLKLEAMEELVSE